MWLLAVLEIILALAGTVCTCRYCLHMLQLESYQLDGYSRFIQKNAKKVLAGWALWLGLAQMLMGFILPILVTLIFSGDRAGAIWPTHLIMWVVYAGVVSVNVYRDYQTAQKKKMVYTKRMKRLIGGLAAVTLVIELIMLLIFGTSNNKGLKYISLTPLCLVAVAPGLVWLAGCVMQPVENAINKKYFVAAQAKLASKKNVIKIGITGSYGKTSTKHALATILSVKYRVLKSPASINTPMGLSALINNKFPEDTEVFIAEMGARKTKDIKELVELIHPSMGLITSVGPQHLETFGTVDKVANTKFDLVRGLPKNGTAFFASDNSWVDRMYKKATCEKYLTGYKSDDKELNPDCDMWAENMAYGPEGLSFTLVTKDGESAECASRLLGRHNISNIVLCASVARKLGLTIEEIAQGIAKLEPVEHRLQVIPGAMNIIDDAFNSNPKGAAEAVNVLSSFPGKHVIVTPGFVEMGGDEDKFNYEFGKQIAEKCDCAILVGPIHTAPIKKALIEAGFDKDMIATVRTLDEASSYLSRFAGSGNSVLFENDLPDNYNE